MTSRNLAPEVIRHMKRWANAFKDEEVTQAMRAIVKRVDVASSSCPAEIDGIGSYKGRDSVSFLYLEAWLECCK
jgi:hypothetical protein